MVVEEEVIKDAGCFTRLKNAFAGIGVGIVLIIAACVALFWNEGRAVEQAEKLEFGAANVVSVSADEVDSSNQGSLIHVNGEVTPGSSITDSALGFEVSALRLDRDVQIYQWKETSESKTTEKNGEKVKRTTYKYAKEWVAQPISSGNFKEPAGHRNQGSLPFDNASVMSSDASLGAFGFPQSFISKLSGSTALAFDEGQRAKIKQAYPKAEIASQYVYLTGSSTSPAIGDVRVRYTVLKPGQASVVSGQQGNTLTPYTDEKLNSELVMVEAGMLSADKMFKDAEDANTMLTWGLRFGGWLAMVFGFSMLFGPIDVIADIVPIVGEIVDFGTNIIAAILGSGLSLVVVSIGWIVARPLIGILLLVVGLGFLGGLGFLIFKFALNGKDKAAA